MIVQYVYKMKTLHSLIIGIVGLVASGFGEMSAEQSITLTPFDISFLKTDFNRTGISHQILVIKPNQTSSIHVMVYNNDNKTHQVNLQIPMENLANFVSSYSFTPSSLTIYPHTSNATTLHITAVHQ